MGERLGRRSPLLLMERATQYVELTISGQGYWFNEIDLGLGIWAGSYQGMQGQWLRWYDKTGNWVPTDREAKLQATQEAEEANQRAELLAAKLRELGIEPD
jgi:hypothetical protein